VLTPVANPKHFQGYGPDAWGLTASDGPNGYLAHATRRWGRRRTTHPNRSAKLVPVYTGSINGRIQTRLPRPGCSAGGIFTGREMPSIPDKTGFPQFIWGLNQAPITVMTENYRTGLGLEHVYVESPRLQRCFTGSTPSRRNKNLPCFPSPCAMARLVFGPARVLCAAVPQDPHELRLSQTATLANAVRTVKTENVSQA